MHSLGVKYYLKIARKIFFILQKFFRLRKTRFTYFETFNRPICIAVGLLGLFHIFE